jgi:hypothetical protein
VKKPVSKFAFQMQPAALHLGAFSDCRCLRYQGFLDEVRMWHTVVSAHDIKFHKDHGVVDWHTVGLVYKLLQSS